MAEKLDHLTEELDQLSDEEIEARLAAAVWVNEKRAAVLRYLEEKKLGRKKEAQSGELEVARSAKDAAWEAVRLGGKRKGKPRHHHSERSCSGSDFSSGRGPPYDLYEALKLTSAAATVREQMRAIALDTVGLSWRGFR